MGSFAATGYTTWVGGYDMTTDLSELKLDVTDTVADDVRFGQTAKTRACTLEDVQASVTGFWEAGVGKVDESAFAGRGSTLYVIVHSVDGAESSVAYLYQAKKLSYQVGAKIGELLPFSLGIQGARGNGGLSAGLIRGRVAKAKGTVSATGVIGTGQQLGAVAAGKWLHAALQVFSSGTTITVVVESDDNSGFTTPTTRATLGPVTSVSGVWATRVAGPITDTYYRLRVSACTGTHIVAGVIGIK